MIAIVGGGFCGCTLATRLLRSPTLRATDILLIERNMHFGRGGAYAPREFAYLLNVPAAQMSADPQRPAEFLEFARHVLDHTNAADFLPRALYGEYLEHRLDCAAADAPADVKLMRVRGEVTVAAPGPRWRLSLRGGDQLLADEVILALGNEGPAALDSMTALDGSEHAGRIESAKIVAGRIHVRWHPRTERRASRLIVDRIVNCTGSAQSLRASSMPLIRSLLEGGWIAPDPLGLGLHTGRDGEVLDASGAAVRGLYYVGPLLRARHWEATAVPELRRHVEATASALEQYATPVSHRLRREVYAAGAPAA